MRIKPDSPLYDEHGNIIKFMQSLGNELGKNIGEINEDSIREIFERLRVIWGTASSRKDCRLFKTSAIEDYYLLCAIVELCSLLRSFTPLLRSQEIQNLLSVSKGKERVNIEKQYLTIRKGGRSESTISIDENIDRVHFSIFLSCFIDTIKNESETMQGAGFVSANNLSNEGSQNKIQLILVYTIFLKAYGKYLEIVRREEHLKKYEYDIDVFFRSFGLIINSQLNNTSLKICPKCKSIYLEETIGQKYDCLFCNPRQFVTGRYGQRLDAGVAGAKQASQNKVANTMSND